MDDHLRALARVAKSDSEARFRLHAALDRRFLPDAPPLTEAIEGAVAKLGGWLESLLGELRPLELARAVVAPSRSAEGVSWEWLEGREGVLLVVREAGAVAIGIGGPFFARFADDDDGSNVGERMLALTPLAPPAAFVAWARSVPRFSEEIALRWAHRTLWRSDVGPIGQNAG